MAALPLLFALDRRNLLGQTTLPAFRDKPAFTGLSSPTAVAFSPDGRVFVAEKRGTVKVFSDLSDTTPTIFADLRVKVYNNWDRGLLGLALHPDFPTTPYVYVLYTYDAAIGAIAPRWGPGDGNSDPCPSPPDFTGDGCVVSGRISRLQASGDVMVGHGTGSHRGLVPAVSRATRSGASSSDPTARSTRPAATERASTSRTTGRMGIP